jgi:hypothetical protein
MGNEYYLFHKFYLVLNEITIAHYSLLDFIVSSNINNNKSKTQELLKLQKKTVCSCWNMINTTL